MPESVMMSELALIAEANPPATDNKDFPSMLNESTSHIVSLSSSTHSVSDPPKPTRDSSWLQVDLCRNFLSDTCPRGQSCRYAHLESRAVVVKDGKVTCCYDFLKVINEVCGEVAVVVEENIEKQCLALHLFVVSVKYLFLLNIYFC